MLHQSYLGASYGYSKRRGTKFHPPCFTVYPISSRPAVFHQAKPQPWASKWGGRVTLKRIKPLKNCYFTMSASLGMIILWSGSLWHCTKAPALGGPQVQVVSEVTCPVSLENKASDQWMLLSVEKWPAGPQRSSLKGEVEKWEGFTKGNNSEVNLMVT